MVNSLAALDNCKFPFARKVLAAAERKPNFLMPTELLPWLEDRQWEVMTDQYCSRTKTLEDFLVTVDTQWVFLSEEDVAIHEMPHAQILGFVAGANYGRNQYGVISMNLGGSTFETNGSDLGDLGDYEDRIICRQKNEIIFFRRDEHRRNRFFLSFPAVFIRTDILRQCHEYAKRKLGGMQIEEALSEAYFALGMQDQYKKATIVRDRIGSTIWSDPAKLDQNCLLYSCLDPNQGSSPLGGNHCY